MATITNVMVRGKFAAPKKAKPQGDGTEAGLQPRVRVYMEGTMPSFICPHPYPDEDDQLLSALLDKLMRHVDSMRKRGVEIRILKHIFARDKEGGVLLATIEEGQP